MSVRDEIEAMFRDALDATGRTLSESSAALAQYAADQADLLALAVGEPNFEQAVIAARDNVALRAGIEATNAADQFDMKLAGFITGALRLGARALAVA